MRLLIILIGISQAGYILNEQDEERVFGRVLDRELNSRQTKTDTGYYKLEKEGP